ncbi:MAG TPA: chemotaxis protein CheW [Opitutus sp.]|nr:chemotaxis protein CheW [Opitutus sp.]
MNPSTPSTDAASPAPRYLTFRLAREIYGVPVLGVQEIIRLPAITSVPQLPPHVRGVFNLRGRVIAIIDLRQRFGVAVADDEIRSCVVVVQVPSSRRGLLHLGLVVDGVEDTRQIAAGEIAATPDFGCAVDTAFLLGIAKTAQGVIPLLNLARVLTDEQVEALPEVAA